MVVAVRSFSGQNLAHSIPQENDHLEPASGSNGRTYVVLDVSRGIIWPLIILRCSTCSTFHLMTYKYQLGATRHVTRTG